MSNNAIDLDAIARSSDPHTSHESAEASKEKKAKIAEHVLTLAIQRGRHGITINEATYALPQFKPVSVSPVFKPLVNKEKLFRRVIGKTTKGRVKYETRIDPETKCRGIIHYHFLALPDSERKRPLNTAAAGGMGGPPSGERRLRERRQGDRRQ